MLVRLLLRLYSIGNVGKTASEAINIGNVGKTASKPLYSIGNVGKTLYSI